MSTDTTVTLALTLLLVASAVGWRRRTLFWVTTVTDGLLEVHANWSVTSTLLPSAKVPTAWYLRLAPGAVKASGGLTLKLCNTPTFTVVVPDTPLKVALRTH